MREKTAVINVRADNRDLATILRGWIRETGSTPQSMSWLVRESLGLVAIWMGRKFPGIECTSTEQAHIELEQSGLRIKNLANKRALARGMQLEALATNDSLEDMNYIRRQMHQAGFHRNEIDRRFNSGIQSVKNNKFDGLTDQQHELLAIQANTLRQQGMNEEEVLEKTDGLVETFKEMNEKGKEEEKQKFDETVKEQLERGKEFLQTDKDKKIAKEERETLLNPELAPIATE